MTVAYRTDPGRWKAKNEDSLYVNAEVGLFILADGMGGHNAGEIASEMAATLIGSIVEEGLGKGQEATEILRSAIKRANETILRKSLQQTEWSEMGTTVLVALLRDEEWVLAHVGDSRAYIIREGFMEQITQDHTFVAEWLREGLITEEEARTHAQRHGLTETLGVTDDVEVDINVCHSGNSSCLLLCSDGLTDEIKDGEISAIIQSSDDPSEACRRLVDAANDRGGKDNITVILVCP